MFEIGIVGAGVIGLNTGIEALKSGAGVTIYEAVPHDPRLIITPEMVTTARPSDLADAQWLCVFDEDVIEKDKQRFVHLANESLDVYLGRTLNPLYHNTLARRQNFEFTNNQPMPDYVRDILSRLGPVSESTKVPQNPLNFNRVWDFYTLAINSPAMLKILQHEFTELGGKLVTRKIETEDQFYDLPHDAIVNCMGLGARDVFKDQGLGLEAVKGQLIFYDNPGIDTIVSGEDLVVMPRSKDRVVAGALFIHEGQFDTLEPTPEDTLDLQTRINQMLAIDLKPLAPIREKLAQAKMLGTTAGLRPYRKEGVLIEAQTVGNKTIVHNVGHGGMGWTLAPGSAKEVARLIKQLS